MKLRFHSAARSCQEVGRAALSTRVKFEPRPSWAEKSERAHAHSTIAAVNLELGLDSALFIRGKGGGLSWNKGQRLTCIGPKTWVWDAEPSDDKLEFQFLLNDEIWERGSAHVLEPGDAIELTPDFEWPDMPRTAVSQDACTGNEHH